MAAPRPSSMLFGSIQNRYNLAGEVTAREVGSPHFFCCRNGWVAPDGPSDLGGVAKR